MRSAAVPQPVDDRLLARRRPAAGEIPPRGRNRAPLSAVQESMWRSDQEGLGGVTHFVLEYRISGPLDREALERAVTELHRRHGILRSVFPADAGRGPEQLVLPPAPVRIERLDVPGTASVPEAVSRLAGRSYAIEERPPVRWALLRVAEHRHVLLLCLHHLLADAGSEALLQDELTALYTSFSRGLSPDLPPPGVQYADYAAWQHERAAAGRHEAGRAHWRHILGTGQGTLPLPYDRRPRPGGSHRGATYRGDLEPAVVQGLRRSAREARTTVAATVAAAWAAFLADMTRTRRLVFGTMLTGRTRPGLARSVGPYASLVPLGVHVGRAAGFRSLQAQVRDAVLDAAAHEEAPFQPVADAAATRPATYLRDPVQTACYVHDAEAERVRLPDLEVHRTQHFPNEAACELSLAVEITGPAAGSCLWEYRTELFDATTVKRMHRHFVNRTADVVAPSRSTSPQGESS